MRIHIIGSKSSWYLADLQRAAENRHVVQGWPYEELSSVVGGEHTSVVTQTSVGNCDATILRTMPPGSLEQVIFRMDALGCLERGGTYLLNSPRAMEVAIDKFLATSRIHEAGLLSPMTHVSQRWQDAIEGFQMLGGDVVIKPLFGGEGRGITRASDEELAVRAFKMLSQMGAVIYQQQFIEHEGSDIRVLVLGKRVWAMRRRNANDWRSNISRGATAEPTELTSELRETAFRAAEAVGALFAGVDILEGRDGKRYVLEVNAVPGWKATAAVLNVDIAAEVLKHLEEVVGQ